MANYLYRGLSIPSDISQGLYEFVRQPFIDGLNKYLRCGF